MSFFPATMATESVQVFNSLKDSHRQLDMYTDDHIAQIVYGTATGLGIVLANVFVIYGFSSMKKKPYSNCLFLSIAISDLINGLTQSPFSTMTRVYVKWPFGEYACYAGVAISGVGYLVSNYMLLILAYHRFSLITRPFRYNEKCSRKRELVLVLVWNGSFAYKIITALVHISLGRVDLDKCMIKYDGVYLLVQNFLMNITPTTAAVVINLLNICVLLKKGRSSSLRRNDKSVVRLVVRRIKSEPAAVSELDTTDVNRASQSMDKATNTDRFGSQTPSSNDLPRSARLARNRLNKNKKAVVCISLLILNSILTEYFFLFAYPYVYFCSCRSHLLKYSVMLLRLFPLINPVLVFLFHDSFRLTICQKLMVKKRNSVSF